MTKISSSPDEEAEKFLSRLKGHAYHDAVAEIEYTPLAKRSMGRPKKRFMRPKWMVTQVQVGITTEVLHRIESYCDLVGITRKDFIQLAVFKFATELGISTEYKIHYVDNNYKHQLGVVLPAGQDSLDWDTEESSWAIDEGDSWESDDDLDVCTSADTTGEESGIQVHGRRSLVDSDWAEQCKGDTEV